MVARIRLGLDPRIGAGLVKGCKGGAITSETYLKLYSFGYYTGKTLTNETSDVFYRLSDVTKHDCFIPRIRTKPLLPSKSPFSDRDRMVCADSLSTIQLRGHVTVENFAAIRKN